MTSLRAAVSAALVAFLMLCGPWLSAQSPTDLVGVWTINRQLSQFPKEVGFSASFLPTEPAGGDRAGQRRGVQSETQEGASRVRFLTDEVRLPPDRHRLTLAVRGGDGWV